MSHTKALPKSKAKNAFDLLSEIAALTKDEPRRMRMESWGGIIGNAKGMDKAPSCGTVGCIGGWVDVLKGSDEHAIDVLGIDTLQADELFYGEEVNDARQGTVRHARRVIALIRRFQKKYAKQLKAKRV